MSKYLDNSGLAYLWGKIKAVAKSVVHVGTTAPTDDVAQVWINPDGETTVTVPTVSEMNAALAEKRDKTFNIVFTDGDAEDPAYYDENSHMDCDKSIAEIKAAYEAGKEIKAYHYDMPMETIVRSIGSYMFAVIGIVNQGTYSESILYAYTQSTEIQRESYQYIVNKTIESQPTASSTNLVTSGGVAAALDSKIDEPSSDGSAGQVLTTDGNGGRSWATVQGGVPSPATAGTAGQVLSLDSNLNTVWVDADSLLTAAEGVSF